MANPETLMPDTKAGEINGLPSWAEEIPQEHAETVAKVFGTIANYYKTKAEAAKSGSENPDYTDGMAFVATGLEQDAKVLFPEYRYEEKDEEPDEQTSYFDIPTIDMSELSDDEIDALMSGEDSLSDQVEIPAEHAETAINALRARADHYQAMATASVNPAYAQGITTVAMSLDLEARALQINGGA